MVSPGSEISIEQKRIKAGNTILMAKQEDRVQKKMASKQVMINSRVDRRFANAPKCVYCLLRRILARF